MEQKPPYIDNNVRAAMARGLVKRKALIDKTCSEVIELLGEPESYEENECQKSKKLRYIIGEAYFSIEPTWKEYLTISFGKDEKVKNAEIYLQKF